MSQSKGKFKIIPNSVFEDNRISPGARLLYAEILSRTGKNEYCWPGNKTLAKTFDKTPGTIKIWLDELESVFYIKRTYMDEKTKTGRKIYPQIFTNYDIKPIGWKKIPGEIKTKR
jgi:hypothetical protein